MRLRLLQCQAALDNTLPTIEVETDNLVPIHIKIP